MSTLAVVPEQRTVLHDVSWETYERLLADHADASAPLFSFDRGTLEIMSPYVEHEKYKQALSLLVEILAEGLGMDIDNLGSTTFKRSDLERGFEADVCFYVRNAARMAGRTHIDAASDPPPGLVIEVEMARSALPKLPMYAAFGVPEIWRYDGERFTIVHLRDGEYLESAVSGAFPGATADALSRLTRRSLSLKRREWIREVRSWVSELSGNG
jgi:Uma2 family endonuclease